MSDHILEMLAAAARNGDRPAFRQIMCAALDDGEDIIVLTDHFSKFIPRHTVKKSSRIEEARIIRGLYWACVEEWQCKPHREWFLHLAQSAGCRERWSRDVLGQIEIGADKDTTPVTRQYLYWAISMMPHTAFQGTRAAKKRLAAVTQRTY